MTEKEFVLEITKAVIAVGLVGAAIYMAIAGQQVPEWLYGFVGLVIGCYFSAAAARLARRKYQ